MRFAWFAIALALALAASATGCSEPAQVPVAAPPDALVEDNWEPGKDLAGTQVVIGGVVQEMPADAAAAKRKLDDVAAEYDTEMDALERKRLQRFSGDSGSQPDSPDSR